MKTTITTTIDGELKLEAMPIIQNKLNKSVAQIVTEAFQRVILENKNKVDNGTTN